MHSGTVRFMFHTFLFHFLWNFVCLSFAVSGFCSDSLSLALCFSWIYRIGRVLFYICPLFLFQNFFSLPCNCFMHICNVSMVVDLASSYIGCIICLCSLTLLQLLLNQCCFLYSKHVCFGMNVWVPSSYTSCKFWHTSHFIHS